MQHAAVAQDNEGLVEVVVELVGVGKDFAPPIDDNIQDFLTKCICGNGVNKRFWWRACQGDAVFTNRPADDECIAVFRFDK
jgi:hypothetical protein